jgi:hypothetical protein
MLKLDGSLNWTAKDVACPAARPAGKVIKGTPLFVVVAFASVTLAGRLAKPTWIGPAIAEPLMFVTVTVPLYVRVTRL